MAGGLSDLQKKILEIAFRGYLQDPRADAFDAEILQDHFGWSPSRQIREDPCAPVFSKQAIGPRRYNSCMASVSRSISRLEDRGLIRRFKGFTQQWSGVKLTVSGVRVAGELSTKPPEKT